MRKILIIFALALFWHGLTFSGDAGLSKKDITTENKINSFKANQISGANALEKTLPENTRSDGMLNKTAYIDSSYMPNPENILLVGNTVNDAIVISELPYNDSGSTVGYTNNYDEECPFSGSTSPDVIYVFSPTSGMAIDIDLHGSAYDTKLYIYEDAVTPGNPYACNEDYYDDYTSAIFGLTLDSGHSYYIVIDGYGGEAGDYVIAVAKGDEREDLCPEGCIFSQSTHLPGDDWSAATSDAGTDEDYLVYDNFEIDDGMLIRGIQFWGLNLQFDTDWSECSEDPMTFEIIIYSDSGGVPGMELAAYTAVSSPIGTGMLYAGNELNKYYVNIEPALAITSGWISIQSISDPAACWFLWMSSSMGAVGADYQWDGVSLVPRIFNQAFCLVGVESETEICEQTVIGPEGNWNFLTSDTEIGPYIVYDNFACENLTGVGAIRFWGLDLHFQAGWSECYEDPTEFEIKFYPDTDDAPDVASPLCSYTVVPERVSTGILYAGIYELNEYYAEFEPCGMNSGWISIQSTLNEEDSCLFLWACSDDGDMMSYQYQDSILAQKAFDLSLILYDAPTSVEDAELLPAQFDMLTNYPNPFNAQTTIAFSLKESGNVSIDIFDVLGQRVDKLDMGYLDNTRIHTVSYDAGNLATGVYFYSLIVNGERRASDKFSLLK